MLTLAQINAWEAEFDAAQAAVKRRLAALPADALEHEIEAAFAQIRQLAGIPIQATVEVRRAD